MYVFIFLVYVTVWPPIGKIAAHSAYDMFSRYKYLIVSAQLYPIKSQQVIPGNKTRRQM